MDSKTGPLPVPDNAQQSLVAQDLIRIGKLTSTEIAQVRAWQHHRGTTFAEAAISMGLVRREDLMKALSRQYSYPILTGDTDNSRFSDELVVGHDPFGSAAEEIRSIRSSIVSSAFSAGIRSFVVVSPRKGAGGSFFCGNIALAFAQMAVPTLLVDADLRTPRIAQMFGLNQSKSGGLSEVLRSRDVENVPINFDIIPGLSILTAGSIPPNPQELLSSAEFLALTNNLAKDFGMVIYDTSSAMDFADAHVVAARVGAVVIVARQHQTTFSDVSTLTQKFDALQCKILGSILNTY